MGEEIRGGRKLALFLVFILAMNMFVPLAFAKQPSTELVEEGTLPAASGVSGFTVSNAGVDSQYVEPSNTATDSVVRYYFVTYDSSYTNGATIPVTYKGTSYSATVMKLAQTTMTGTGNPSNAPYSVTGASLATFQAAANTTYFFDAGNFVDNSNSYNYRLSAVNSSIVGLGKDGSGEPTTKIYKTPYTGQAGNMGAYNGYLPRFMANSANVYYENLTFDGLGYDMGPNGGGISGIAASRGEDFWAVLVDCSDFVMKDIILQNVGYDSTTDGTSFAGTQRKNVGLWVRLALTGQRNFENLKIRNIKTKSATNCGTVHLQATANNYFKDLDMSDNTQMGTSAYPVRVEQHTDSYLSTHGKSNIFAGTLDFPDVGAPAYSCVLVGDYRYRQTVVPSEFKYALCNSASSSASAPAIRLYTALQPRANNLATLDLDSGYWLMTANTGGTTGNATLNQQLTSLKSVASRMRTSDSALPKPAPNIHITSRTDGTITGFTVPNYVDSSGYNNSTLPVNILVQDSDEPELDEYVPFTTENTLALPSSNTSNISLFGIDFADTAEWSIDDATTGGEITNFARANSGSNIFYTELLDIGFYNQYDGSLIETQTIDPGTAPVAPVPTRTGYDFAGWSTTSTPSPFGTILSDTDVDSTVLTDDTNYYAVWTPLSYTITFNDGTSLITSQAVDYDAYAVAPANPVKPHYTFLGWSTAPDGSGTLLSGSEIDALPVTGDVSYYASYEKTMVSVTFLDYDSSFIASETVWDGDHATPPADPTRAGYDFLGWSTSPSGGTILTSQEVLDREVTGPVTYYAQYAKHEGPTPPQPPTPPTPPTPPQPPTPPNDTSDVPMWTLLELIAIIAAGCIVYASKRHQSREAVVPFE